LELLVIIVCGLLMSAVALVGGLAALVHEEALKRVLLPMVSLSAGSLLGAALFHLIPKSIEHFGIGAEAFVWVALGFALFFVLEQFLHWHHCHGSTSEHQHKRPLTYLLLIADGVHNLIGGLAVGALIMVDIKVGITAFLVEAAHELPQEIGDFGVLVYGGWSVKKALVFNFLSGLTFLLGGLIAYAVSTRVDLAFAVPFAAGNFLYIAAVDLVPEINKHAKLRTSLVHFLCFVLGLGLLLLLSRLGHD
jgi:zinc and cadmium transporter